MLSDKTYILLKWVVQLVLPALSTLYFTLGSYWGFPCIEQVVGTLAAVATFLGAILGISTTAYNKNKEMQDAIDSLTNVGDSTDDVK